MKKLNILIFAGCSDKKLISKISPILDAEMVEKVFLIRNTKMDFEHNKLYQYPALSVFRKLMPLREVNRFLIGIYILLTKKIDILLGIHFVMHCIYSHIFSKLFKKEYICLLIESPVKYKENKFFLKVLRDSSLVGVRGLNSKKYLTSLGIPSEKFFIPPNEFYMPNVNFGKVKQEYDVIYAGNFVKEKDLPLWVESIYEVKKEIKNVKAIMLGDGKLMGEIGMLVKQKDLESNIQMVGRQKDVYSYIDRSRVLLMTSKTEALPMAAIESMSIGIPVVLPNVGDISDLIQDGVNGFLVNSRDPKDFANAITKLLREKELYTRISKNAYYRIKDMAKESSHEKLVKLWENQLRTFSKDESN